jgi:Acetyl-CoA carboxylase, central region
MRAVSLLDTCGLLQSESLSAQICSGCVFENHFFYCRANDAWQSVKYPWFFAFRVRDNCQEDPIFRHFDPPMAYQVGLARLLIFDRTKFGYPKLIHVFSAQDKFVGRIRGATMTGKPGRIEASGRLGAGFQESSPNMKNAEVVRSSRSDNISVSSHGLSNPVPSGNLPPMAPGVLFKIMSPPEDFYLAIGGRNDSHANSNAD